MTIRNPVTPRETPEEEHARAKQNAIREAEERAAAKARELQEQSDRQQGLIPPKKEK
jgi:hypothetical protein